MSFPQFLEEKGNIIPLCPLWAGIPRDGLVKGIPFSKVKYLAEEGYRQFGVLLGEKWGLMAVVSHESLVVQLGDPHIKGPPYVWFFPWQKMKEQKYGEQIEIVLDGYIPIPPARSYLNPVVFEWGRELTEAQLLPLSSLALLSDGVPAAKNKETLVYSYMFRPFGLAVRKPPILDDYDREQFSLYIKILKGVISPKSGGVVQSKKKYSVSLEEKVDYLRKTLGSQEEFMVVVERMEKFIPEATEEDLIKMMEDIYENKISPEVIKSIPEEYRFRNEG